MALNPGQSTQQLQRGQRGVEVRLPGGDEPVAHEVRGADEHGVTGV